MPSLLKTKNRPGRVCHESMGITTFGVYVVAIHISPYKSMIQKIALYTIKLSIYPADFAMGNSYLKLFIISWPNGPENSSLHN